MSVLTTDRLLPVLLIGALLLCHGALGSLHQLHDVPDPAPMKHAQHHGGNDASDDHPASANYAAVFFALLFWLVYGLLRSATGARTSLPAARAAIGAVPAKIPILPRGPTFLLLQVFRL